MNKLQKLAPAWHAEALELLRENFSKIHRAFLDSTKRAVWFGIFLNEIKARGKTDGSIPHGEFGPWLKANLPDLEWRQANVYMHFGREVCEKGKFQISDYHQFATAGNLPPDIERMIEGKTQKQLCLEFKQMEDGEVKCGRLKGEGGKRALSAAEKSEKLVRLANDQLKRIREEIYTIGINFAGLPDDDLQETIHYLDGLTHLLKSWTNTPTYKRDLDGLQAQWNKYFKP